MVKPRSARAGPLQIHPLEVMTKDGPLSTLTRADHREAGESTMASFPQISTRLGDIRLNRIADEGMAPRRHDAAAVDTEDIVGRVTRLLVVLGLGLTAAQWIGARSRRLRRDGFAKADALLISNEALIRPILLAVGLTGMEWIRSRLHRSGPSAPLS